VYSVFKPILEVDPTVPLSATAHESKAEARDRQNLALQFKVAICALTLLRYVTEHINLLPLSALVRVLDKHDFILALVPMLDSPPWTRSCPPARLPACPPVSDLPSATTCHHLLPPATACCCVQLPLHAML
jgi:hypothetical protein